MNQTTKVTNGFTFGGWSAILLALGLIFGGLAGGMFELFAIGVLLLFVYLQIAFGGEGVAFATGLIVVIALIVTS